ncbi:MAG: glycosyltransferase [Acidobacteria bacterium]|nr:glycosyltransferase [Acidobacteriota bacterium]
MGTRTRVLFLIPSLVAHGAERQLCELARAMDKGRFEVHVATFYAPGDFAGADLSPELGPSSDVTLHCLGKRRGWIGYLPAFLRLVALAWRTDPHLVHGYMDGNLPALLVGGLTRSRVVWGIRATRADLGTLSPAGRLLVSLGARLSTLVDLMIYNARSGLERHRALGFRPGADLVIPNGFDVERFRPEPAAGRRQREAWGIGDGVPLVGIVGRLAPVKDHATFLRAAARIAEARPEVRFVVVGEGAPQWRRRLEAEAATLGLGDRLHWAGHCGDMGSVYNALSLLLLTSVEEGFPNVLGEAMACGIPCVSTQVGDAALLLGEPHLVVPPGDDEALARTALRVLGHAGQGTSPGAGTRDRILAEFSTPALARRTEAALSDLLHPSIPDPR